MNLSTSLYILKKSVVLARSQKEEKKAQSRELISSNIDLFKKTQEDGIQIIQSDSITDIRGEEGFIKVDFGAGVIRNGLLKDDEVHLFSYREPSKETLSLSLVKKADLADHFGITKSKATYELLAEKLNMLTDENKIEVKRGKPFLAASTKKDINLDVALDNLLLGGGNEFWQEQINKLAVKAKQVEFHSLEESEILAKEIDSTINKLAKEYPAEAESPYISWRKGRESFSPETILPFIIELEKKDINTAIKITKEGGGEAKLKIKGSFHIEAIENMEPRVLSFVKYEHQQSVNYLAEKENKEELGDLIPTTTLKI